MCADVPRQAYKPEEKPATKELKSLLKKCSVYLIGPMGSGKSAVAKYLAQELGFRFLDIDELVTAAAQKTVAELFEDSGEDEFRNLESSVLDQVQAFIGCVVATGGGVVTRQMNWGKLQTGIVVFLDAPVDVLVTRLKGDKTRPLLAGADDLEGRISSILEERRHLYEQADVTVNISAGQPVDDVGNETIRHLGNFIKANPPRLSDLYPGNLPNRKEGA